MTQKWLKSGSGRPTPKWPKSDSGPIFESFLSYLGSLWGGALGVTFESLLGHFNPFWVSVDLGARPLHNPNRRLFKAACASLAGMNEGFASRSPCRGISSVKGKFCLLSSFVGSPPFHWTSSVSLLSEPPWRGRKNGAARKLSKSVEKLFDAFWRFLTFFALRENCRKVPRSVEKVFDAFWRFLTLFDVAPFCRPLLQSADPKSL